MPSYKYEFYEDDKKNSPTYDFLENLSQKCRENNDKKSRTLLKAIYHRLKMLEENGTRSGMPDFEYIGGDKYKLWQIRIKHTIGYYRIFICQCPWQKNKFVILNYFLKKEAKTPESEIIKAEKLMDDYIERKVI